MRTDCRWAVLVSLTFIFTPARADDVPPLKPEPVIHIVTPRLNGMEDEGHVFLIEHGDNLLIQKSYLDTEHIQYRQTVQVNGSDYVPLNATPASRIHFARTQYRLEIDCPANCFPTQRIDTTSKPVPTPSPVSPGLYLNYDLTLQQGDITETLGAFLEAGFFSDAGSLRHRMICTDTSQDDTCVRLDTVWTRSDPRTAHQWETGDTITHAAPWGEPVRFGGIRWGTDYRLQPDFITFPTPTLSGEANLPGTIDVLIDGILRFQDDVAPGPFSIDQIPFVTGAGQAQIIVTDLLGRETVLQSDYYAAPTLLKPGLRDYSIELGAAREAYGIRSDQYGEGFLAANIRQGVTDHLTIGSRSEMSEDHQAYGLTVTTASPVLGLTELSAAAAHRDDRKGHHFSLTHEWRSQHFSIGGNVAYSSPDYLTLGQRRTSPRLVTRSFISASSAAFGQVSLNWTGRDQRTGDDFTSLGLQYTKPIAGKSFHFSALKVDEPEYMFWAQASLTIPFGASSVAGIGVENDDDQWSGVVRARRSAPLSGGVGYHGVLETRNVSRADLGINWRHSMGDASAQFSRVDDRTATRVTLRGGMVMLGDSFFFSPTVTDSMAIVEVGEEPGIRVYHDQQLVGETDKNGRLIISRLRSFEENHIRINPRDVGLSTELAFHQTDVTPGLRTGHRIDFQITRPNRVMAHLVLRNGLPLPTGAIVEDPASGQVYPIGHDGRIYIPLATQGMVLHYQAETGLCNVTLTWDEGMRTGAYFDLGRLTCQPERPYT